MVSLIKADSTVNLYAFPTDMTKSWNGIKNGNANGMAQFQWKLYFIIIDLFCRYNRGNNKNFVYIIR